MMTLEVNGAEFTGFTELSVTKSFLNVSASFSFVATPLPAAIYPIRVKDEVKVVVDGVPVLAGFVEKINGTNALDNHTISIDGRDKTADIVDSTLDGTELDFESDISLKGVCEKVINKLGISDMTVVDNVSPDNFKKGEIEAATPGETAFDFLEKLARKKQVILNTDGEGNLVIDRGSTEKIQTVLNYSRLNPSNNILSSNMTQDHSGRFNKYVILAQQNVGAIDLGGFGEQKPKEVTNVQNFALDNEIRTSRILHVNAENSQDSKTCEQRAKWEANYRRSQSFTYSCTVHGHKAQKDGIIWRPNLLVQVFDEFFDVGAELLIDSVTWSLSLDDGEKTELQFVTGDAYQLQAEKDVRDSQASKEGGKFVIDF